ncbi:purine-cytosine permease family protein [Bacillus massiliigorillae]|uniref:purine-cytosine permease family protein n=1 Tax=Bacillus massiliigorillae TaxID=1243664 RepID=UPI0003A85E5C|nr:cytosine permease [Bacillus massiliigorillae]
MSKKYPDLIPEQERTGSPKQLFWIWFSLNIGVMGLVYGGIIVSYGLNFVQSVVAAVLGAASFALIGYLSLPGKLGKAPTFVLSRAAFGSKGNLIPAVLAWICLIGWLSVGNVPTGIFSLNAIVTAAGFEVTTTTQIIGLIGLSIAIMALSLVKQETLVKAQTIFTYIFGALTVVVLFILVPQTDWSALVNMPNGDWIGGVLPAISIIIAGSALSWAMCASDYSCYQSPNSSNKSIFITTTLASATPLFVIMFLGILMNATNPELVSSADPIAALALQMPKWMVIPYFITALGGIIPPAVISLRSGRTALEATNIKLSDRTSIIFHGAIMILLPTYVLFINGDFLGSFQMFLGVVGIGLAAWTAVFVADYIILRKKQGYDPEIISGDKNIAVNKGNVIIWFASVITGLLFTENPLFPAPFAKGIFEGNSLGVLLTFAVGFVFSWIYSQKQLKATEAKQGGKVA